MTETGGATCRQGFGAHKGELEGEQPGGGPGFQGPQAGWSPSADTLSLSAGGRVPRSPQHQGQLQGDLPLRSQCRHHKGRQPRKHGQGGVL